MRTEVLIGKVWEEEQEWRVLLQNRNTEVLNARFERRTWEEAPELEQRY